ncbi:hypothetical protein NLU13_6854 [Sarocladium strictum]|uniref:Tetratricopeptide repeat protein 1 n=1 Tax=Sarocladium strictum TaxID=5046 RepID=A0AA39GGH9_SARSR|nr:hypothetical protein NLU13_6854 [Sarocladium strictum]
MSPQSQQRSPPNDEGPAVTSQTSLPSSDEAEMLRFPPEEEAALLKDSQDIKAEANALFIAGDYQTALERYDDALNTCPKYLDFDRAVLQSNVSACHLKLEQWKDAAKAASTCLDGLAKLEREDPLLNPKAAESEKKKTDVLKIADEDDDDGDVIEEIISNGATRAAPIPPPQPTPEQSELEIRKANVLRIRTKALLRRARARAQEGGWQNLAGAEDDYKTLSQLPSGSLAPGDARTVRAQLRELPPRTKAAQEKEMGEMWGKLKQLGDGILKPFGLSTNNFQMVKDEGTGGYSMNFTQGQGGPSSSSS